MTTKQALFLALAWLLAIVAGALASTVLGPNQVSGVPQLPGQFGFMCATVAGNLQCQIDTSYMLNLGLPCPAGGLPCPLPFTPGVAPPPGPCPSTGSVIATNEPAVYFCVVTTPGGAPGMNWIRVAGVNTW